MKPLQGVAYSRIHVFALLDELLYRKRGEKRGVVGITYFLFAFLFRKKCEYVNTRITVGTKGLRHSRVIRHSRISAIFTPKTQYWRI